ncbi:MAG: alanine dehydrogenase [Gammaproteobacteria bacterium]|nr:alanine dehydrogenase [Gammaproteobacteria bacterium]
MLVGIPKEVKIHEYRVGLMPAGVREVVAHGHKVLVETGAGMGVGVSDADYRAAGADIAFDATEVFGTADMIVKVKEPQVQERAMLRKGQILFTFLHLAPDPDQTRDLVESGAVCIAYETVTSPHGGLPLLAPMSEVAGRMSVQAGAHCLEKAQGGMGMLLGGVPGVEPAKVVILGGGVVGRHAAQMAVGLGAGVTILDRDVNVLQDLWTQFGRSVNTVFSTRDAIERHVLAAHLVIGAVLVPGATTPKLVTSEMVRRMQPGAVVVDVAIDQGGCVETSHPTTHADPIFEVDGVIHYCVANMPGAVPRTANLALNNVTLPFVVALAGKGYRQAMRDDRHLLAGLNVYSGEVTCRQVAESLGYPHKAAEELLGI